MADLLTKGAQHLPYPILLRAYAATEGRHQCRLAAAVARRAGIPLLDIEVFRRRKNSDTVFVLGSGSSINRIGSERWQAIAAHDTIGFNFWPIHPFVPTFYLFESLPPASKDPTFHPGMFPLLLELFARRADDYARTPKLVSNLAQAGDQLVFHLPEGWKQELYAAEPMTYPARSSAEFRSALKYAEGKNAFDPAGRAARLFKYSSNLVACLTLALRLGYRRIVLCGVDLDDQAYFYQDPEFFPDYAQVEFAPRNMPHFITRSLPWLVPIDEVLLLLKREIMEPRSIELCVESRSSALWPRIPEAPQSLYEVAAPAAAPRSQG